MLLEIISVDFDISVHILITYSALVEHLRGKKKLRIEWAVHCL